MREAGEENASSVSRHCSYFDFFFYTLNIDIWTSTQIFGLILANICSAALLDFFTTVQGGALDAVTIFTSIIQGGLKATRSRASRGGEEKATRETGLG